VTHRIRFALDPEAPGNGKDPGHILDELRRLGDCRVVVQTWELRPVEEFNPSLPNAYWDVVLTTSRAVEDIRLSALQVRATGWIFMYMGCIEGGRGCPRGG
jgi:hypothetical protein